MPYTPPSQQSPVASGHQSPPLRRSQPFPRNTHQTSISPSTRQGLPSSASYIHKHRRSPSASQQYHTIPVNVPATPDATPVYDDPDSPDSYQALDGNFNRRPSPSTNSDLTSPPITAISPPDSLQSSSDDEEASRNGNGRDIENLAELQAAIQVIEQRRESSPNRSTEDAKQTRTTLGIVVPPTPTPPPSASKDAPNRPPLSKEARRISHSRSSTESSSHLDVSSPLHDEDTSPSFSTESDNEESEPQQKPPMLRKKSGELVTPCLRPPSARRRPSSMPGTPTFSKAVHFDAHLEHVRHFLQIDRPLAVSAGSSPVENYDADGEFPFSNDSRPQDLPWKWEISLSNFPQDTPERRTMPVRVERVFLSSDNKHLIGTVAVKNLAYQKFVVTRFTLDYWKTTSEVVAEYNNDVRRVQANDGCDRFNFDIRLEDQANLEDKTLFFCVRYNVNGQEYWDSNMNVNYQVDFSKKPVPVNGKQGMQQKPLPRSHSSPGNRVRPLSDSFDDFGIAFDWQPDFNQPAARITGDQPFRFKNPDKIVPDAPSRRTNVPAQAFGNRYDFGASLSAARQATGSTFGERGGLPKRETPSKFGFSPSRPAFKSNSSIRPGDTITASVKLPTSTSITKPTALTSEKPSLQSQSYNELLDKYCFYGTDKLSRPGKPGPGNGQTDGIAEDSSDTSSGASSPNPPPPPPTPLQKAQPTEQLRPSVITVGLRNSQSPPPAYHPRTASPASFGYPYHKPMQNSIFADSHTPTAIRG